jgi:hypothetical protein
MERERRDATDPTGDARASLRPTCLFLTKVKFEIDVVAAAVSRG